MISTSFTGRRLLQSSYIYLVNMQVCHSVWSIRHLLISFSNAVTHALPQ